jgi:ribosomal protein S18 acetylase RimI-like enzyme
MFFQPVIRFIDTSDPLFEQAKALRYAVLFGPFGVSKDTDFEDDSFGSIHAVALSVDKVIGYGRLQRRVGEAQIRHLCVDPAVQGGGVGTMLLRALIDRAQRDGINLIYLNARFTAMGVYRRVGFHETGPIFHTEHTHLPHKRMELVLLP